MTQSWDAKSYNQHAGFVSRLGMPVVDLLAPQAGERILDVGCGEGAIASHLVELGCEVVGIDGSRSQIDAAQARGLDAHVMDAHALPYQAEFDAVFSNAALHWMKRPDAVIAGVAHSLKPGGRFVAEMGGGDNVGTIRRAVHAALRARGVDPEPVDPWYFPSVEAYREKLEAAGFVVDSIQLIPRPTPLPTGIAGWLITFTEPFLQSFPHPEQQKIIEELEATLAPQLYSEEKGWVADYVRLRFSAHLTS